MNSSVQMAKVGSLSQMYIHVHTYYLLTLCEDPFSIVDRKILAKLSHAITSKVN